jgi:hypothetical protein
VLSAIDCNSSRLHPGLPEPRRAAHELQEFCCLGNDLPRGPAAGAKFACGLVEFGRAAGMHETGRRRRALLSQGLGTGWQLFQGTIQFELRAAATRAFRGRLPLGAVTGVQFVSLQNGPGEEEAQRPPTGLSLLALGHKFENFDDTAAVVANLDLVISVDTAVAHLAGALGKPCWVLLPDYRTDWRWLTYRTDSPWYPERMRLFRQPAQGDWYPVITAVVDALKVWVAKLTPSVAR